VSINFTLVRFLEECGIDREIVFQEMREEICEIFDVESFDDFKNEIDLIKDEINTKEKMVQIIRRLVKRSLAINVVLEAMLHSGCLVGDMERW